MVSIFAIEVLKICLLEHGHSILFTEGSLKIVVY